MDEAPKKRQLCVTEEFNFDPEVMKDYYRILATRLNAVLDSYRQTNRLDRLLLEASVNLSFAMEFMQEMDGITQAKVMTAALYLQSLLTKIPSNKIIAIPGILSNKKGN